MMSRLLVALFALSMAFSPRRVSAEAPPYLPLQGYLTDSDGKPVNDSLAMRFRLYASARAATPLFEENQPKVLVQDGYFNVYLGDEIDLDLSIFAEHPVLFVGILVGGDESELSPRLKLATAPYAGFAQACGNAQTLGGLSVDEFSAQTISSIGEHCFDTKEELTAALDEHYLSLAGGKVNGPISATEYAFAAPRTEYFTVAGAVFVDQDHGDILANHDISGSMFFNANAPADAVIYATASVQIPHGATIVSTSCFFSRGSNADSAAFGLWRSNGDGTAKSLSYRSFPADSTEVGTSVALTATGLSELVDLPGRAYFLSVRLTNSVAGVSKDRLSLNNCYVEYSRPAL